jgi:cytochrome c-type biogenesis protein CcmH
MVLWLFLVAMTSVAVFAVLWPLRRRSVGSSASELAIFQDQFAEIERDRALGRIADSDAAAARVEVSRRLLGAEAALRPEIHAPEATGKQRGSMVLLAAMTLLPAAAFGSYLAIGSPGLPGQPLSARISAPAEQRSIETLVAQVESHLAGNPDDGRGWEVLAPVYLRMGRFDDSVKARRAAVRLLGSTGDREADLGEAIVAAANGVVTAEAKDAFQRGLSLDQDNVKARFFLGLSAEQDGQPTEAASIWREILAQSAPGAPWVEFVRQALTRVEGQGAKVVPPGPTADDLMAAEQMSPQQRLEMARGMVQRLADRLKRDGSDVEDWLRLVRAYAVLGDLDRARGAAAEARRSLGADADKVRRVDELVRALGLEG